MLLAFSMSFKNIDASFTEFSTDSSSVVRKSLTLREQAIFAYIRDITGLSAVPRHVPLGQIAFKLDIGVRQVGYAVNQLVKKGYIERFVSYKPLDKKWSKRLGYSFRKESYYRLPHSWRIS